MLCSTVACGRSDGSEPQSAKAASSDVEVAAAPAELRTGIHPDDFQCDQVVSGDAVSKAVNLQITVETSSFEPPTGVARACNYIGHSEDSEPTATTDATADAGPAMAQQTWSFDVDCRATALDTGRSLLAQWGKDSGATALEIGKQAIDHRDVVLLLIDDDTPCYARILGPGQVNRKAIAKLLVAGLSRDNAPAPASAWR